jgi:hypothetical protein
MPNTLDWTKPLVTRFGEEVTLVRRLNNNSSSRNLCVVKCNSGLEKAYFVTDDGYNSQIGFIENKKMKLRKWEVVFRSNRSGAIYGSFYNSCEEAHQAIAKSENRTALTCPKFMEFEVDYD